jgi:hypothetical protein
MTMSLRSFCYTFLRDVGLGRNGVLGLLVVSPQPLSLS